MGILTWSKECPDCQRRYPSTCGIATCLACRTKLEQTQKAATVSESEFKELSFVYGRTIPGPLPEEERDKIEQEWDQLDAEVARRGARWGWADLIGDGFGSVRAV